MTFYALYRSRGDANALWHHIVLIPDYGSFDEVHAMVRPWAAQCEEATLTKIDDEALELRVEEYYGWYGTDVEAFNDDDHPPHGKTFDTADDDSEPEDPLLPVTTGELIYQAHTLPAADCPQNRALESYEPWPGFAEQIEDDDGTICDDWFENPDIAFIFADGREVIETGYRP